MFPKQWLHKLNILLFLSPGSQAVTKLQALPESLECQPVSQDICVDYQPCLSTD